jgi:hypothetical protein
MLIGSLRIETFEGSRPHSRLWVLNGVSQAGHVGCRASIQHLYKQSSRSKLGQVCLCLGFPTAWRLAAERTDINAQSQSGKV